MTAVFSISFLSPSGQYGSDQLNIILGIPAFWRTWFLVTQLKRVLRLRCLHSTVDTFVVGLGLNLSFGCEVWGVKLSRKEHVTVIVRGRLVDWEMDNFSFIKINVWRVCKHTPIIPNIRTTNRWHEEFRSCVCNAELELNLILFFLPKLAVESIQLFWTIKKLLFLQEVLDPRLPSPKYFHLY